MLFTKAARAIRSQPKLAWGIMSPPSDLHLANRIAAQLSGYGWEAQVVSPRHFSDYDYWIVIRPESFDRLPPKATRIIYQLAPPSYLRHTPRKYLSVLKASWAVLEHAQENLALLLAEGVQYPRLHYVPLDTVALMTAPTGTSGAKSDEQFCFMFERFLVAMSFLPATHVRNMKIPFSAQGDKFALSLPETPQRRKLLETTKPDDFSVFDGMRRRPGWIGCGLSYQLMAQYALSNGLSTLTIMEDDAILPLDFKEKLSTIHTYLEQHAGEWDIFAGVIADLAPECVVRDVNIFDGLTFVTIDRMTSTVFNIYGEKALRALAAWNPENLDPSLGNTIDRALGSLPGLRVVTLLPFFVGHQEDAHSTLWGIQNTHYTEMIQASETRLDEKVRVFANQKPKNLAN
jgi:hypothetical protein